ncbi:MAG: hypothetical protein EBQ99_00165 [Planctomycetes bacterium]|nr:hypothetical protein [Planctomycetota bacterium]
MMIGSIAIMPDQSQRPVVAARVMVMSRRYSPMRPTCRRVSSHGSWDSTPITCAAVIRLSAGPVVAGMVTTVPGGGLGGMAMIALTTHAA